MVWRIFLNAYSQKRSNVDQRQRSAHYHSINTAGGNAPKPAAKPPARGVPVVVPAAPPPPPPPPRPPPQPLALHPMPAAVPVVDDFNYVDSASEGPEEVRTDSSLEMLDEEEELGCRTQGWDDLTVLYAIVLPAGRNFAQAPIFHDFEPGII